MNQAGMPGRSARIGAWSDAARAVVVALAAAALWLAVGAYPGATSGYIVTDSPSDRALAVQRQAFPDRSDIWLLAAVVDPTDGIEEVDTFDRAVQDYGVALSAIPGVSGVNTPRAAASDEDSWRTQSSTDGTVRWFRVWFEPETRVTTDMLNEIDSAGGGLRDLGASVAIGGPAVESNHADLPILPLAVGTGVVLLSLIITCRRSLADWNRSFALLFVPAFAGGVAQLVAGWTGSHEWGPAAACIAASVLAATACRSAGANALDERTLVPHALALVAAASGAFVLDITSLTEALPTVVAGVAVAWLCCTALPRITHEDPPLFGPADEKTPMVQRLRRGLLPSTAIGCGAIVALLVLPTAWSPIAQRPGDLWLGDAVPVASAVEAAAPGALSAFEVLVAHDALLELSELRSIELRLEASGEVSRIGVSERSPLGTVAVVEALPTDPTNDDLVDDLRSGELTNAHPTSTNGSVSRRVDAVDRLDRSAPGLIFVAMASWAGAVFAAALLRRIDRRRAHDFEVMVDEELRMMLEGDSEQVAEPLQPRQPNPRDFGWRGKVFDEAADELSDQSGDATTDPAT